jgi:hypothetical protein
MRSIAILTFVLLVPATALADNDDVTVKTVIRDHVDANAKPAVTTPPPPPPPPPPPVVVVKAPPKPVAGGYVAPSFVPYEGGKIPADAKLTTEPNMLLVGAGLTVLGLSYVPSIIAAAAVCSPQQAKCDATPGAGWLYLPVVGPFITAAMATSPGGQALAAFDGALQVTGAALAVAGLVAQKKLVMWQDKSAKLSVTPGAGNAAGVSLTLTHL